MSISLRMTVILLERGSRIPAAGINKTATMKNPPAWRS